MSISVSQCLRHSGKLAAEPNGNTSYYKTKQSKNSAGLLQFLATGYRKSH